MDQSARATISRHHVLGGLNGRYLFSHGSGSWKSEIKVPAKLVSGEISLADGQLLAASVHVLFLRERALVFLFLLRKTAVL